MPTSRGQRERGYPELVARASDMVSGHMALTQRKGPMASMGRAKVIILEVNCMDFSSNLLSLAGLQGDSDGDDPLKTLLRAFYFDPFVAFRPLWTEQGRLFLEVHCRDLSLIHLRLTGLRRRLRLSRGKPI
jgi:hypothetical protein